MNTYFKYCPNVFLAKCDAPHQRGEVIPVTTKYGKENLSIVFNLIFEKDGFYYYSIVRADGFNCQEWAKRKAERRQEWAKIARKKSEDFYKKARKDSAFLSLGEPVKVGHHSEKRHRRIIKQAWDNTDKFVEFYDKSIKHENEAKKWQEKETVINLSMPESIDYFKEMLEAAQEYHEGLKSGKYERPHSASLAYAKIDVNELRQKYDMAVRLWGDI